MLFQSSSSLKLCQVLQWRADFLQVRQDPLIPLLLPEILRDTRLTIWISGCSIQWTRNPDKTIRLLNWLDKNPVERDILFEATTGGTDRSKSDVGIQAALAVFAADEHPLNRIWVRKNPGPFGQAILSRINGLVFRFSSTTMTVNSFLNPCCAVSLKKKYEHVNNMIGPVASRLRFEDIEVGSLAHGIVGKSSFAFYHTFPDRF